jgi:hypothetical protein
VLVLAGCGGRAPSGGGGTSEGGELTIPVLVMFLALQRQFIRSIASAGVKG